MLKNAIGLFLFAIIIFLAFLPSYTKLQDLRQRSKDYDQQIKLLQERYTKLKEEERLLKDDPIYLEKVAREKMGLIREGEVVYKIKSKEENKE